MEVTEESLINLEPRSLEKENAVRVVWALAWPVVALNSFQVVNTLLDRAYIGHLEESALTAHGGVINVMFLLVSLAVSLSTGATAIVSRAYGAKDREECNLAARQAFRLALYCGVIFGVVCWASAYPMARLVLPSTDHRAIAYMTQFTKIYALCMPATFIIQTFAGCLRGVGDTKSPMYLSSIQIVLHAILNTFLIFPRRGWFPGLGLGLSGAAWALTSSTIICSIGYLIYIQRTRLPKLASLALPTWAWTVRIVRISSIAAASSSLRAANFTLFTVIVSVLPGGSAAIAGMSTAFAIESIMIMPAFGFAATAGALVGQSLGAKEPHRAARLTWTSVWLATAGTLGCAIPLFIFAPQIVGFMVGWKADVTAPAVWLLRALCSTEAFFSVAMVLMGGMQGAGDVKRPLLISFWSLWVVRMPMALFLAFPAGAILFHLGASMATLPFGLALGDIGAWVAVAITQVLQGLMAVVAFQSGRWKYARV